jgi:hypothetical protein
MSPFEDAGSKEHLTPREAYDPDEGKPKRVVTTRARGTATSLRWPLSRSLAHAFSLSLFVSHPRSLSLSPQPTRILFFLSLFLPPALAVPSAALFLKLELVDRALRDTMGGAYGRMLHRAKRTERIKASNLRDRSRRSSPVAANTAPGQGGQHAFLSAMTVSSIHAGAGAPPLPTLLQPRFLYSARASARTFCGVGLVEDFARCKHKPKALAGSATRAFERSGGHDGGLGSPFKGAKSPASPMRSPYVGGGLDGAATSGLPSACFEFPYVVMIKRVRPLFFKV